MKGGEQQPLRNGHQNNATNGDTTNENEQKSGIEGETSIEPLTTDDTRSLCQRTTSEAYNDDHVQLIDVCGDCFVSQPQQAVCSIRDSIAVVFNDNEKITSLTADSI